MRKRKWFCKTGSDVSTYPDCSQIWSVKTKWSLLKLQFGFRHIKVFHGITHYDYESTAATKHHSDSVQLFRLLCSQTGRIRRNFNCSNYENRRIIRLLKPVALHLERATMSLYFQGIAEEFERGMDWFEESSTQPIVMITRNGEVGTPRLALAREQLETLQGTVVFQLPRVIVARLRCQVTVRMILPISCV